MAIEKLVVALGNPGPTYAATRHNIAWQLIDRWSAGSSPKWRAETRFQAEVAQFALGGQKVMVVKPLTFMNDSGVAAAALARFFKLEPRQLIVIYDELNLPVGGLKISVKGSAGGHNGVASVLQHCGDGFLRLRLGIGQKPHREMDLKDWVLGRFTTDELAALEASWKTWIASLDCLIIHGPEEAMRRFHVTPKAPKPPSPEVENPKETTTTTATTTATTPGQTATPLATQGS